MRGEPLIITPPLGGLRTDIPPHLLFLQQQFNVLVDGQNVYIGQDGLLHPRAGYTPLQAASNTIKARINGGYSFQDQSGTYQYVVSTDNKWWTLGSTGQTWLSCPYTWTSMPYTWDNVPAAFDWQDITNSMFPRNGAITDPAQWAVFFQGGFAWLIGVDNFSTPMWWNNTLGEYAPVNYSPYTITSISEVGTLATVNLSQPVTNIAAGDSITIAGNSVSGYNGSWVVNQVLSPTRLTFTAGGSGLGVGTNGSLADQTTMLMPPARDVTVMTNRVVIINTIEQGTRYVHRVRWSASDDATRWPVLAFIDVLDSQDDPLVAIQPLGQNYAALYCQNSIYLLVAQEGDDANAFSIEPIESASDYTGPASPAAVHGRSEGLQFYITYDGRVQSFDGVTVNPISAPIDAALQKAFDSANASKCHAAHLISERHVIFFFPTTLTDVVGDPSAALVYDLQRQIFLPFYFFEEGITASFQGQVNKSMDWINCPYTWTSMPYTWETAPVALESDMMTATASGEVDTFFRGVDDGANNYAVPWSATWPYIYDPKNVFKFEQAEFYFTPVVPNLAFGVELATMQFQSLTYPNDPGTPLVSFALDMVQGWTNQPVEPGPVNPANVRNNLIAMTLSSSQSKGGAGFVGGMAFFFKDARGQYGNG